MYSNIAEGEDDKMVERCQKDKDGTLIFVSSHVCAQMIAQLNGEKLDWFILCHRWCTSHDLNP